MSRSRRGGKPVGWEHWGKRKGSGCVDRRTSHKMERMQLKEILVEDIKDGLEELNCNSYFDDSPLMKSLFPEAKQIECYHHYVLGYDVLVVDGVFKGEYNDALELLSYAYHNGVQYKDYADLSMKYMDHLDYGNPRWSFLP